MNVLVTGGAGNLGSHLVRNLMRDTHEIRVLVHHRLPAGDIPASPRVRVHRGDLGEPRTLSAPCRGIDCIVHFAGVLFSPRPERFLPATNVGYVQNLVAAALDAGARKFILISFPQVEGESFPDRRATGRLNGTPISVHAQTRLAAEQHLFEACAGGHMVPVSLRAGAIYARGILMVEAARWLLRHRLLAVWRQPTWYHLLALPDFLTCVVAAIEGQSVSGIYNLGDDQPLLLQEVLDTFAAHWGFRQPWRLPRWSFYAAAWCCEAFAMAFRTSAPLTQDFITIGMVSHVSDTSRMKRELLPRCAFPTLRDGLVLL